MRNLFGVCLLSIGCAPTPEVKLHVDPAAANRVEPAQRQRAVADGETARKSLATAEAALKHAEAEPAAPAAIEGKARTPEIDAVVKAGEARRRADIAWRQAQLDVARWQVAVADAQLELAMAEAVARTGAEVDPARFRAQAARMQNGHREASHAAARARGRLDDQERALNEAKNRYASTLRVAPAAPTESAQK
jgi:hypothetical protein